MQQMNCRVLLDIAVPKLPVAVCMALTLVACETTIPARTYLCEPLASNGWQGDAVDWRRTVGNVQYSLRARDDWDLGKVQKPAGDVHWVIVDGWSAAANAMVFDPAEAVLAIDGDFIHALPKMWRADFVGNVYGLKAEVPTPHDLNDREGSIRADYLIAFPVKRPIAAGDTYSISLGAAQLNGMKVQLPSVKSCYFPAQTQKPSWPTC
jgi:hypothetical protein